MKTQSKARDYCFKNSWRLRRDRKRVGKMVDYSVDYMEMGQPRESLKRSLKQATKEKYPGNPVVVWILLNVMMPIVIKLVLRWWEKRNQ